MANEPKWKQLLVCDDGDVWSVVDATGSILHEPFEGVNLTRERAVATANPARSYCWLAVILLLAIFAVALSGGAS